jgi:hypothetical protein
MFQLQAQLFNSPRSASYLSLGVEIASELPLPQVYVWGLRKWNAHNSCENCSRLLQGQITFAHFVQRRAVDDPPKPVTVIKGGFNW